MPETTDHTPLTPERLAAIEARARGVVDSRHRWASETGVTDQDALWGMRAAKQLAVGDVPALVADVRRLQAEVDQLREAFAVEHQAMAATVAGTRKAMAQLAERWRLQATQPAAVPDSPATLGRALLDSEGDLWRERGPDWWQYGTLEPRSRAELARTYGEPTEVLLVSPGVARVLDAVQVWREADRTGDPLPSTMYELAVAVDALGDPQQPLQAGAEPTTDGVESLEVAVLEDALCRRVWAAAYRDVADFLDRGESAPATYQPVEVVLIRNRAAAIERGDITPWADQPAEPAPPVAANLGATGSTPAAEPTPEPAAGTPGDGPGWSRAWLLDCMLPHLPSASYNEPDLHDEAKRQVEALLAWRDKLETENDWNRDAAETNQQLLHAAQRERDTARAELAEVTAERDRLERLTAADRETIAGLRAERNRWQQQAVQNAEATHAVIAERDRLRAELDQVNAVLRRHGIEHPLGVRGVRDLAGMAEVWMPGGDAYEEHMATARRDAAADALEEAANDASRLHVATGERYFTGADLRELAAQLRRGTRPTPGSPEPAQTEGGRDA